MEKMNKKELVKLVVNQTQMTKKDATTFVNVVFDNISEALKDGKSVKLYGFGNFEVRERSARKGRNPQTGEELMIAPSKAPTFKASKPLKKAVNS